MNVNMVSINTVNSSIHPNVTVTRILRSSSRAYGLEFCLMLRMMQGVHILK